MLYEQMTPIYHITTEKVFTVNNNTAQEIAIRLREVIYTEAPRLQTWRPGLRFTTELTT